MIKLLDILNEIKIANPTRPIKFSSDMPILDLKIGKYDVGKGRRGVEVNPYSKSVNPITLKRVETVLNKLGIQPERAYIGWLVDNNENISLKSTFITSTYKGKPILFAQTQTESPKAGQMYVYSEYFKSGKAMRLSDPNNPGQRLDDSYIFADRNATKDEILRAFKYDTLNEITIANPAAEQMLETFIDDNFSKFARLSDSEVEEYEADEFDPSVLDYLKSNERFDYRGICVYWADDYGKVWVENMSNFLEEITITIPKYYAVFNIYGEHNKPPMYIISSTKEDMIERLNSAIEYFKSIETENPRKWNFKYYISDLDDETKILPNGTIGDTYIWDDWAIVTDKADTFNKHIGEYENYGKEPEEYIG